MSQDEIQADLQMRIVRLQAVNAHLEDQLETARLQVEHARLESEKADDEAMHWKAESLKIRSKDDMDAYRAIKSWERRAKTAEAKLKELGA